ncbi:hypothetical protein BDF20DRAFT_810590 [Mycotypha africana]|uniref:uncharacterized protein n=1 Tax=Mycotypha africana TaxID=64632 RepID=UPI0023013080|nr:uncharacterized protein BDF20DRAFT_810590 [Mycotypha africana]KAI8991949.1 hypothetical protein BDF20DRAFT_810590 [Mycotypha africana]
MRTAVIKDLLHHQPDNNNTDNCITHQIREVTLTIKRTINSIYEIFVSKENNHKNTLIESYVMSFQKTFLIPSKLSHGNETPSQPAVTRLFSPSSNVHLLVRYLPESIQNFTPQFNPGPFVEVADVRELLKKWISEIKHLLEEEFPKILSTVKTQIELVSIRSKVWALLDADENVKGKKNNKWQHNTEQLLGTSYSVWENLYRTIFNNRAKLIIDEQLEELVNQPHTLVWPAIIDSKENTLRKGFSVTVNIWPDPTTTKYFNAFSLPNLSSSKEIQAFKSALTETVYDRTNILGRLQKAFDDKLEQIRKDIQEHMNIPNVDNDHFQSITDAEAIKEYFQDRCYASVLDFCEGLNVLMKQVSAESWMDQKSKNYVIIFLGRFARNIGILSKELPRSITVSTILPETASMLKLHSNLNQDSKFIEIQEHLLSIFHKAHDPWLSFLTEKFTAALKQTLISTKWNDQCSAIQIWEGNMVYLKGKKITNEKAHIRKPCFIIFRCR